MDEDQELIRGINSLRTEVELGHCFGALAGFAPGLLLFEGVDPFDGREEANLAAVMLNSLDAQGRGSMRFSSAGATDQHDVLGAINKLTFVHLT